MINVLREDWDCVWNLYVYLSEVSLYSSVRSVSFTAYHSLHCVYITACCYMWFMCRCRCAIVEVDALHYPTWLKQTQNLVEKHSPGWLKCFSLTAIVRSIKSWHPFPTIVLFSTKQPCWALLGSDTSLLTKQEIRYQIPAPSILVTPPRDVVWFNIP